MYTYPTAGTELDNIADILRRAHLEDGVPWGDMAVLVRAGSRSIPTVRRALTVAGVPLDIDGDDLPLRHEPAVAPLLTALRAVARAESNAESNTDTERRIGGSAGGSEEAGDSEDAGDVSAPVEGAGEVLGDSARVEGVDGATAETAETGASEGADAFADGADGADGAGGGQVVAAWLGTETALTLLASPLASMDAADLRRLGRALREEERAAGNLVPPPSDELLARALAEPERLVAHDPAYARGAQRLGALLRKARERLAGGGSAEEALWDLWQGTPWPQRLERAARRGGAAGRNADRDLDAVCALFATAARAEERTGGRGP